jgi:UDP-glucuronate 4-epimerase
MPKENILVTGAAGLIGSHAAEALIDAGYNVIGADNFCDFYDRSWKEMNLQSIHGAPGKLEVEEIDITDGVAIDRLVELTRPKAILHLAAMAGVRPSIEQPGYYARVNVEGTTHLLQAAVRHNVGKFLFASSSSVYGNRSTVPFSEEDPVGEPISPYAATKRAGELLCYTYWHLYRLPVACLRFFTVYGPRQRPEMAIHKLTDLMARGKTLPLYGDGSSRRDYTYIDDIVDGLLAALELEPGFEILNLGGADTTSLRDLVHWIAEELAVEPRIDYLPAQPGDVPITYADVSKAARLLGYSPKVPIREGLRRFVSWYRERAEARRT